MTTAPSRFAVASACSPATPAPITSTRAGLTVPAAVIIRGNIRGSSAAASSTALYPEMVAIDDSASMLWARVVRGISSTASRRAPAAAHRFDGAVRLQRLGESQHRLIAAKQLQVAA